jgi:CheY-like chemotaxis protein
MTGNRENLLSGMTDASRVFPRRISQEGHVAARKYQESHPCSGWHPLCFTLFDMANRTKKILIVDNNDAWRDTLGGFIKGLGHEVFEAATGLEAVDRASSLRPDLIMMDLSLPEMNGDEATVRLKRNASTRNIPVVINTSWSMSCNVGDRADRALDAGAEEILYKPFHLTALREVLRTYLLG